MRFHNVMSPPKGFLEIERMPTACTMCGDMLVNTYVPKAEVSRGRLDVYIICGKCVKLLPGIIREKLKHPATPKII